MNHADNLFLRGHDWGAAAGSILLIAMALGIASNQTSRWFTNDSAGSVAVAAHQVVTIARLAAPHHETFPAVLTVPFAVTRTQRMMVARVKHGSATSENDHPRSGAMAGPRLLTGLALLGASQSSGN